MGNEQFIDRNIVYQFLIHVSTIKLKTLNEDLNIDVELNRFIDVTFDVQLIPLLNFSVGKVRRF